MYDIFKIKGYRHINAVYVSKIIMILFIIEQNRQAKISLEINLKFDGKTLSNIIS